MIKRKKIMKKVMTVAMGAMMMMSCASEKAIVGKWNIEEAQGKSTAKAETQAYIEFDKKGKFYGNTSVNRFFGSYKLKGDKITLSNVGSTMMMGRDMEIEQAVLQALEQSTTIKADKGTATVKDANNKTVMVLKK